LEGVSDCEELVGLPDRRDADPWRSIQAQIHLMYWTVGGQCAPSSSLSTHNSCISISQVYYSSSANWLMIRTVR